ncbi:MAG TPA: (2Fe-2S) ferredoxin domain-containing protein [Trichocoleus sp.]
MIAIGDAEPQFRVLEGQFVRELRSSKGKLKGICLQTVDREYSIKLPKYLRPMLARELEQGGIVRVWVSPKKEDWVALNVIPLTPKGLNSLEPVSETLEASRRVHAHSTKTREPEFCVQVCRKGSCCKRGSREIYDQIETAIATNPALENVRLESTGCLKECKKGPAIRISPTKETLTHVTPQTVEAILEEHCSQLVRVTV